MSDSYISTTLRLNKTNVESLQPPARGVLVAWDDQLPGFHVRVTPTGTRTYYARGRLPGTRSPGDIKIGRHGVFTAEQARSRAKTILAMLAAGQDPRPLRLSRAEQEEVKRGNISFGELCDLYLAEHRKRDVTSSHRHSVDLWFDEYLKGELGHIPVRDLNTEHLRAFHQRHAHHPTTANRLVFWASVVCDFAEPRYRPLNSNPCWTMHQGMKKSLIEPYPEESRERCLTDEEVKRVAVAITEFEDDGRISATEADLLRVKMLTGCRSSELYRLKWPEVHLDQGYIELPEHKTKKKTGKKRVLPLSDAAALLIDRQPRRSEYVFYNEGGQRWRQPQGKRHQDGQGKRRQAGPLTISRLDHIWHGRANRPRKKGSRPWGRMDEPRVQRWPSDEGIRDRAGIPDVRLHDVRRTVATVAGGAANLNAHLICAILGWSNLEQAKTYVRPPLAPLIAGANAIAAHLMPGLVDGSIALAVPDRQEDKLCCSFCDKTEDEVHKLVAGPTAFICDECIKQCADIVREQST